MNTLAKGKSQKQHDIRGATFIRLSKSTHDAATDLSLKAGVAKERDEQIINLSAARALFALGEIFKQAGKRERTLR